jgi:serine/threonine protein kinase
MRRLGSGGMGVVYLALDRERNLAVALKTLRHPTADAVLRFKREFRSLQDVQHPNLVCLGELYEEAQQFFFTMELVDGVDFFSYVRTGLDDPTDDILPVTPAGGASGTPTPSPPAALASCPFREDRLRLALAQLAGGVSALHAHGKIHRDIKPSNIRVSAGGRVVLLDFGLVTETLAHDAISEIHVVGTTSYMSPEQAAAMPVTPAADWYSVGVVLYQALTGRLPFYGTPMEVMLAKQQTEPRPPRSLVPAVPEDLDAICRALLKTDPRRRAQGPEVLRCLGRLAPDEVSLASSSSLTQAPPFIGRVKELARLHKALSETRRGRQRTLVLEGESGMGKSALLRHFAEGLKTELPRPLVLSGRCYEREDLPYKAFDGVVDALVRHLCTVDQVDAALLVGGDMGLVARVFPVLRRVEAVRHAKVAEWETPNPQELRNRVFAALRGLLSRLAERAPLVVCIDDFQWADADSLMLLGEVLHEPEAPALLLVLTVRAGVEPGKRRPEHELARLLPDVEVVTMAGLRPEETRELAVLLCQHARGQGTVDPEALAKEAAGHPLFLSELVRYVATVEAPALGTVRLDDALWARISRLDAPARHLLEAVAIAGAPVPLAVAAAAADLPPTQTARCPAILRVGMLARTTGARLKDTIDTYHDRVRDCVLAHLDADERRRLHARLADALEAADPGLENPKVLVRHLIAAGLGSKAARYAVRAAEHAGLALAFDQSAEYYRLALELGEHRAGDRRALLVALGHALAHAGRCAEAAEAFLASLEGADVSTRLEMRRVAAEMLLVAGHIERGLEEMRLVLLEVGIAMPRTLQRALGSLLWHRARLRLRGLRFTARGADRIPPRERQELDVYKSLLMGLNFVDPIRGADSVARGLLGALRVGDREHVARFLAMNAAWRAAEGLGAKSLVDRLFAEARRIGEGGGDTYLHALLQAGSGGAEVLSGRFSDGVRQLVQAEASFEHQAAGNTWEKNSVRFLRLVGLRELGAMRELDALVHEALRDGGRRGDRWVETTVSRACNLVWLARGDLATARRVLEENTWCPPASGFMHLQHWYELRARGEIELYAGTVARAPLDARLREVAGSLLMRVQLTRVHVRWLSARLALAEAESVADTRAQVKDALSAARRLEREGVPYATAWAHLVRAAAAVQHQDADRAVAILREAMPICEEAGVHLCAAVARRRLGELLRGSVGRVLIKEADAWMRGEGIKDPERLCEVVAPGFTRPTPQGPDLAEAPAQNSV